MGNQIPLVGLKELSLLDPKSLLLHLAVSHVLFYCTRSHRREAFGSISCLVLTVDS